ncbi:MAG: LysR family transcriptional regulator [Caulobacteraceae bacterium]|nr:LysR family transcriptional regulator [Caulobacteraceae bacterium]
MDLNKFDLNLLKALDVLLEERNVTRAAERLFITQQAASGALQRLRRHFDDDLLSPVGRRLEPTPLALSLVLPVREALLATKAALGTRPTFDPQSAQANCRIAMTDYSLLVALPRFLRRLSVDAPRVRCTVEPLTKNSFDRLDMGDLDFCLAANDVRLYGRHRPGKLIRSEPMFQDDFVCVVDPRYVDISRGMPLSAYKRLRHNSVAFGEPWAPARDGRHRTRQVIFRWCAPCGDARNWAIPSAARTRLDQPRAQAEPSLGGRSFDPETGARTRMRSPETPAAKRLFTVNEFCTAYGTGRSKTYELIRLGLLKARKLDGKTMIRAEDAEAFVERLPPALGALGPSPGRRRSLS